VDLVDALRGAVEESVKGERKPAVLFSGGLDSSVLAFLAKKANAKTVLYVAGFEGSEDLAQARANAALLEMRLVELVLKDEDLAGLVEAAKKITGETEFMKIELGFILLALCKRAKKDGLAVLVSGTGAEEMFLGYHSHSEKCAAGEDLDALRGREIEGLYEKDVRRSEKIAASCGVRLALPFLSDLVASTVLATPAKENFEGGENKALLRDAARRLGLPEAVCARPKRAMQYGTGVHSRLLSLRRKGLIRI